MNTIKYLIMRYIVDLQTDQQRFEFLTSVASWCQHKAAAIESKHSTNFVEVINE